MNITNIHVRFIFSIKLIKNLKMYVLQFMLFYFNVLYFKYSYSSDTIILQSIQLISLMFSYRSYQTITIEFNSLTIVIPIILYVSGFASFPLCIIYLNTHSFCIS